MDRTNMLIMIYFLALAFYGITEILLMLKFSNWKFKKTDKGLLSILFPFYLSIYLAPVEFILLKPGIYSFMIITGFTILILGIALRIIAMVTLRNNFSMAIESNDTGGLVVNGIYAYIRHPLYLGSLLISFSGSIIFSCLVCWLFAIMTFIAILIRIRKEESFLSGRFKEYQDYLKTTYRLIPWIY